MNDLICILLHPQKQNFQLFRATGKVVGQQSKFQKHRFLKHNLILEILPGFILHIPGDTLEIFEQPKRKPSACEAYMKAELSGQSLQLIIIYEIEKQKFEGKKREGHQVTTVKPLQ